MHRCACSPACIRGCKYPSAAAVTRVAEPAQTGAYWQTTTQKAILYKAQWGASSMRAPAMKSRHAQRVVEAVAQASKDVMQVF